jgi:hypothetical protein
VTLPKRPAKSLKANKAAFEGAAPRAVLKARYSIFHD